MADCGTGPASLPPRPKPRPTKTCFDFIAALMLSLLHFRRCQIRGRGHPHVGAWTTSDLHTGAANDLASLCLDPPVAVVVVARFGTNRTQPTTARSSAPKPCSRQIWCSHEARLSPPCHSTPLMVREG
uniref:Uncharacterized protein n=1 Tax=Oryza punctata TaxID=4537 RepID=A0A0E0LTB7_ORYPU